MQRGVGLLEVLIAAAFLSMALLTHAASSLSGHRLALSESRYGTALQTVRQFAERLRSDEDWQGLYARLRAKIDGLPAGTVYAPTAFYSDFEVPEEIGTVTVHVDVPRVTAVGAVAGDPLILREDVVLARYGLPYDLNGDGAIDSDARDGDYRALPILITFHWQGAGEAPQRMELLTWLRGER